MLGLLPSLLDYLTVQQEPGRCWEKGDPKPQLCLLPACPAVSARGPPRTRNQTAGPGVRLQPERQEGHPSLKTQRGAGARLFAERSWAGAGLDAKSRLPPEGGQIMLSRWGIRFQMHPMPTKQRTPPRLNSSEMLTCNTFCSGALLNTDSTIQPPGPRKCRGYLTAGYSKCSCRQTRSKAVTGLAGKALKILLEDGVKCSRAPDCWEQRWPIRGGKEAGPEAGAAPWAAGRRRTWIPLPRRCPSGASLPNTAENTAPAKTGLSFQRHIQRWGFKVCGPPTAAGDLLSKTAASCRSFSRRALCFPHRLTDCLAFYCLVSDQLLLPQPLTRGVEGEGLRPLFAGGTLVLIPRRRPRSPPGPSAPLLPGSGWGSSTPPPMPSPFRGHQSSRAPSNALRVVETPHWICTPNFSITFMVSLQAC